MGQASAATQSMSLPSPSGDFLKSVSSKGDGLPSRIALYGVEKVGKTCWAAQAKKPIFIMTQGETGLLSLINSGQLPETPHFTEAQAWADIMGQVDELTSQEHDFQTLVIDTLNGVERLCFNMVCHRDFDGIRTGKGGFNSWGGVQGREVSCPDWIAFLAKLDALRAAKRMQIILLAHMKIAPFKNPGEDYDRYSPDMSKEIWSLTHKWSDMILFVNFHVETVEKGTNKHRGVGGQQRVMFTERHAEYDAGNRLGLPSEIDMGNSAQEAWNNFVTAVKESRKAGVK